MATKIGEVVREGHALVIYSNYSLQAVAAHKGRLTDGN